MKRGLGRWGTRCGAAAFALAFLGWGLPSALLAALSPGEAGPTSPGEAGPTPGAARPVTVGDDVARLEAIRERLDRRSALDRALDRQIESVDERIAVLVVERQLAADEVSAARAEVARVERELDRLVPRILMRTEREAKRYEASARALASIAGLSRRAEIEPALRARLRAVSPIMLRRLQRQEGGLAALERRSDRLMQRHRELRESLPSMLAAQQQIEMRRQQLARQKASATRRQDEIADDLVELSRAEAITARRVLHEERARTALVGRTPGLVRRAPHLLALAERPARQAWISKFRLARKLPSTAPPGLSSGRALVAATSIDRATTSGAGLEAGLEAVVWSPPPAKPSTAVERAHIAALSDHAAIEAGRSAAAASFDRAIQVRRQTRPITPAPDTLLDPILQAVEQRPVITMPANPGQQVAAPDAGRVVFGGSFGSYGLLLILEHEREYHTILWGFGKLNVATDDRVEAGEIIGVMGGGGGDASELHVEFRRNGRPVGALPWLAASSSKVRG